MATVTVTARARKDQFMISFSKLPGQSFGPFGFAETVRDLTVSALLAPLDARELVLRSINTGQATTETETLA